MSTDGAMRIAVLGSRFDGGGAEILSEVWARALGVRGHEITCYLTHAGGQREGDGPPSVLLDGGGFVRKTWQLRNRFRGGRHDVVLAVMPYWNLMAIIAAALCPRRSRPAVVISLHNVGGALASVHGVRFRAKELLARVLYRYSSGCVAISHAVAAEAVSQFRVPVERVWVVPNPALGKCGDFTVARWRSAERSSLSLVVPARIVRQKRPLVALEVAKVLEGEYGAVRVVYFGVGPLEEAVRSRAAALGVHVELRGWVDEWFDQCPADSVVLLPSLVEGFAGVLVEAAARGIPSVVSWPARGGGAARVPGGAGGVGRGGGGGGGAGGGLEAERIVLGDEVQVWLERFSVDRSVLSLEQCLVRAGAGDRRALQGAER